MSSTPISSPKLVSTNPGRIVSVVTWFLLAVATIAVLIRLFTKRAVSRRLNVDDGLAAISLVSFMVFWYRNFWLISHSALRHWSRHRGLFSGCQWTRQAP